MAKVKPDQGGHVPKDSDFVVIETAGGITDVCIMKSAPPGGIAVKIDKDRYCDTRTGEVILCKHGETRVDNLAGMRRTLRTIRGLINANVIPRCTRWCTFTYAENMTDTKRLYKDFDAFRKRLYRYCDRKNFGRPEYISVIEPQGRGAWHIHAFLIWQDAAPFISNEDLRSLWGHGFVKITACNDVDNIGAYFSAYLADVPLDEYKGVDDLEIRQSPKDGKKYVKGGRLYLYPVGMNIVRHSQGIRKPDRETMHYEKFKKIEGSLGVTTFQKSYVVISDEDGNKEINRLTKIQYNKNRR